MNASTSSLSSNLHAIKHNFFPLGRHAIANESDPIRRAYATLLAAILHSQGRISREQEMLFRRLLDSMNLAQHQEELLIAGYQLEREDLKETLTQIKISNKANAFLFDAMVLTRLNDAITTEVSQLLSEIAETLSLRKKTIESLLLWINILLFKKNKIKTDVITYKTCRRCSWPFTLRLDYASHNKRVLVKDKEFIKNNTSLYIKENNSGGSEYIKSKSSGLVILKKEKNENEFKTEFHIIDFPENLSAWMKIIDFNKMIEQK